MSIASGLGKVDATVKGNRLVADPESFPARRRLEDCVIMTADGRLLLQRHPDDCMTLPGAAYPFGGHVEPGEIPFMAMVREITEEIGGTVMAEDAVFLCALTEEETEHHDFVHVWFWRDVHGTVTGCYEREAILFDTVDDAFALPGAHGLRPVGLADSATELASALTEFRP